MDEIEMMAMEQMMADPGMAMPADPMAGGADAPPGYTMVFVPDMILPAVMELIDGAEGAGPAMGAMPSPMGGGGPEMAMAGMGMGF